jgi:hypothetical protein
LQRVWVAGINEIKPQEGVTEMTISNPVQKLEDCTYRAPFLWPFWMGLSFYARRKDGMSAAHINPRQGQKKCPKCRKFKPLSLFPARTTRGGDKCKQCAAEYTRRRRKADDEQIKQNKSARRKELYRINIVKKLARGKVSGGIKSGRLVRPEHCSKCKKKSDAIHAHHLDYKENITIWLCRDCHVLAHLKPLREVKRSQLELIPWPDYAYCGSGITDEFDEVSAPADLRSYLRGEMA